MPREMNFAATFRRTTRPSTKARMRWMLGLKVRFVTEVIFLPTPPLDLAKPRLVN